jgi:hypothetical protein
MSRSVCREHSEAMLLSSILRILVQNQPQLSPSETSKHPKIPPKTDEASSLQKIENEIAAAAELLKPSGVEAQTGNPQPGPFLEELRRAITKFEKSDQSRVVDVFE